MGSTSSKDAGSSSSSPAASASASASAFAAPGFRRSRSMGSRVFQSSCLRRSSGSFHTDIDDQVSDTRTKEKGSLSHLSTCPDQDETGTDRVKKKGYRKSKLQHKPNEVPRISSDTGLNEWDQEPITNSTSGVDTGTSQALSSRSLTSSSRLRTRFSFIPGNISFRLSRAASLGSSRACSLFSNSLTVSNSEDLNVHLGPSASSANRNDTRQGCESFLVCNTSHLPARQYEDTPTSDASRLNPITSRLSVDLQNAEIVSTSNTTRNNENMETLANVNSRTPRNHIETECIETRSATRRIAAREPVERSVRFSRTLSVSRLRDRVLRRSSLTDGFFGRGHDDGEGDTSQADGRQVWGGTSRALDSDENAEISPISSNYPPSRVPNSIYDNQENELETLRPREARYHDIMEHRTDFLERRRRIRSQVRALQRLGSRFENLSGHERSCILSGQHRTGHCSCRTSNRNRNPDDDTSARASISRIVMLAEALFEVLDEIHQQSVVLSSQPSMSSLGSVPAPKEVVESMPVKIYTELQKLQSEDVPQCYICLLEYEEGDRMRILPCHHEFHRTCIDKWLKEIHRVCPLCRGDVCISDSLLPDN